MEFEMREKLHDNEGAPKVRTSPASTAATSIANVTETNVTAEIESAKSTPNLCYGPKRPKASIAVIQLCLKMMAGNQISTANTSPNISLNISPNISPNVSPHSFIDVTGRPSRSNTAACKSQSTSLPRISGSTRYVKKTIVDFESAALPEIPVDHYVERLRDLFACSDEAVTLAVIYVDRLTKFHSPAFQVRASNIHRLILTALLVSTKFIDDIYFANSFYAKNGGVSTQELNRLEFSFLHLIKFDLYVSSQEYDAYKSFLW